MIDLEITRLCARADGKELGRPDHDGIVWAKGEGIPYSPLSNGHQALELVERLRLGLTACNDGEWFVSMLKPRHEARDANLLRAICLCAARGQQAREAE